ncbi:MAG: sporadic carbohydrate cluster 2OG-Fe(II) oxygenase [Acidobacteriota bacterium]
MPSQPTSSDLTFVDPAEHALDRAFREQGRVILPAEAPAALERIRDRAASLAAEHLGIDPPDDVTTWLETLGDRVKPADLNPLRLAVFRGLNAEPWLRPAVYRLARRALAVLVGNELAMQRRVNLSIQLPDDDSSLLPLHADSWSGDSPYEIVLWIPLVDVADTRSMFLLPPVAHARFAARLADADSVEDLFGAVESEVEFVRLDVGQVLLFNQNLAHGNRINRTPRTRWSLNVRFKGAFTPYADKKLGEFFEPITLRTMSRIGLAHRLPDGFDE